MKKINSHNFSMSKKLIMIYLIIVAIPILIMGIYFPMQMNQDAVENMTLSYQYTAERIASDLTVMLRDYLEIPLSYTYDVEMVSFLTRDYRSDLEQYESIRDILFPFYEKLQYKNANIRLRISHQNPALNMSGMLEYDPEMEEIAGLVFRNEAIGKTEYLTACIPVIDISGTKRMVGIIKVYIPCRLIQNILDSHGAVEHPVFVYDEQGNLITGTAMEEAKADKAYRDVVYQIDYPSLKIQGWKLIYLAPEYQFREKLNETYSQTCKLAAASITASMIVILLFVKGIKRRVNMLVEGMRQLRQGDTKVQVKEESSDEIGQLCSDFNVMVNKLDRLIQDNYRSQIELKNVEIERQKLKNEQVQSSFLALQRQINPHYLFNTLESIRMKVLMNGDRETAEIIEEFSLGYREMMQTSYEMITIEEELKLVKSFFSVIRFRFADRIKLNILLENEELKQCKIFKFMIQPLVENAVYHGVERQDEDGRIDLHIYRQEAYLLIAVKDNGIGMSREKIDEIMESLRNPQEGNNRNLALRNIYSRLVLIYKENFRFEIDSEEGCYTKVQLAVPLDPQEKGTYEQKTAGIDCR